MENDRSLRVKKPVNLYASDLSASFGKLPPQDIDLEEVIIGAMMIEKTALSVLSILKADHFYVERHREIYVVIERLFNSAMPVDIRTVRTQLAKDSKLELCGGAYYLADLTSKVSSSANVEYHARIIKELSMKREIITLAAEMQNAAYEDGSDAFELLNRFSRFQMALLEDMKTSNEKSIGVRVQELGLEISQRTEQRPTLVGVGSGFESLDKIIRGFQDGKLIILACRPSMGKTTLSLNMASNAVTIFKKPTAFFSLEMGYDEISDKIIALNTDIPLRDLNDKVFTKDEWNRYMDKTKPLVNAALYIDDTPSLTITQFRINLRRMIDKYGIKFAIVDYLQLMQSDKTYRGNREQEISQISRVLKMTAKEFGIPILALAQLSRSVETRGGDKRPQLADLRESGAIEQDADIVIMPYRPDYYKITGDTDGTFVPGVTELLVRKHRGGPLGEPCVAMNAATSKFRSLDSPYLDRGKVPDDTKWVDLQPTIQFSEPEHEQLTDDDLPF